MHDKALKCHKTCMKLQQKKYKNIGSDFSRDARTVSKVRYDYTKVSSPRCSGNR